MVTLVRVCRREVVSAGDDRQKSGANCVPAGQASVSSAAMAVDCIAAQISGKAESTLPVRFFIRDIRFSSQFYSFAGSQKLRSPANQSRGGKIFLNDCVSVTCALFGDYREAVFGSSCAIVEAGP